MDIVTSFSWDIMTSWDTVTVVSVSYGMRRNSSNKELGLEYFPEFDFYSAG